MIREKTTEDLRHMTDEEGLILQGCGGDLQEWVDGINELLTQEGILLNGSSSKTRLHSSTTVSQTCCSLLRGFS